MGIVVTVFMLLGLLMALPWVPTELRFLRTTPALVDVLASGQLLVGAWNVFWYGARHPGAFWGLAATVSGLLMIAVALLLLVEHGSDRWRRIAWIVRAHAWLKPHAMPLVAGLAVCLALYSVTLVRLNLGMPIPG